MARAVEARGEPAAVAEQAALEEAWRHPVAPDRLGLECLAGRISTAL